MKRTTALILFFALAVSGCRERSDRTDTIDREDFEEARTLYTPTVRAQLDSGNIAYRARRLQDARRHYRAAVELDNNASAAWFGVYMVEHALGNLPAAQEALERTRKLAPGATLVHPTTSDTIR